MLRFSSSISRCLMRIQARHDGVHANTALQYAPCCQQRHSAGDCAGDCVRAASAGLYCILMSDRQLYLEEHVTRCTLSPSRGTVLVTGSLYGGCFSSAGLYWVTSEKQMSSGFTYFRTSWGTHLHQHSTQLQPVYSLGQSPSHRGSCSYECIDSPRPRGFWCCCDS